MATATTKPEKPDKKPRGRRRGNGEGSVYKRHDGRWCGSMTVGYDEKGKQRRKVVYGATMAEVQAKMTQMRSSKLTGIAIPTGRTALGSYLDTWLKDVARPTIRATTHVSYEVVIRLHIKPRLGGIALTKLTPAHVQGLYSTMEEAGASPRLRQLVHAVLRRAFKNAVRWGLMPRNLCEAVEAPRVPRVEIQPLTAEQVQAMLTEAQGERNYALYLLAVGTGMRLGEIFGLQWDCVDLEAGTLSVRRALVEVKGELQLTEPKTESGRRSIDLPANVVKALADHKKQAMFAKHDKSPWVFCDRNGGPMRRSNFHRNEFKPLLNRAGLPSIRFHDLRHTSATLLLLQGVQAKVVQERLGHSKITLTLDTYSHVLPTMGKAAADAIDSLLVPKVATA